MTRDEYGGPKIPFLRELRSFPGEKCLELWSGYTIAPWQLLRVLGSSPATLAKETVGDSLWKQVVYGLCGEHKLSPTSRALVRQAFSPLGDEMLEAMDTGKSAALEARSPWEALHLSLKDKREPIVASVEAAVVPLAALERIRLAATAMPATNDAEGATQALHHFCVNAMSKWRNILAESTLAAAPVLASTLVAIATFDRAIGEFIGGEPQSHIARYLDGRGRPLTHWIHRVQEAYDVSNNEALARLLLAKGVSMGSSKGPRPITRDTLAKWASGAQLARPATVQVLLSALRDQRKSPALASEYLVARGLWFLVQAVGGLSMNELSAADVQDELRTRYLVTFDQETSPPASGL